MNVAQILRAALYLVDGVNIDDTTHRFFTQTELLAWANDGKDWIERALYQAHQDYNLVYRDSTTGSLRWDGETYAHSSLQLSTGRTYTLPPDVMVMRSIRTTTASATRFEHLDMSDPYFRDVENRTDVTNPVYWDVVGTRTLVLANPLSGGTHVVIGYVGRSRKLRISSTPGTVETTQDSATVTGTSTTWVDQELATPAELLVSTDTAAPKIVSQTSGGVWVDPSAIYPPISTFGSDTSITLSGNWLTASLAAGRGHMVASVPSLPAEYIYLVTEYVKAKCLEKGNRPGAKEAMAETMGRIAAIGSEFSQRIDAAGKAGPVVPDTRPGQSWSTGLTPGQLRPSQSGGRQ